MWDLIVSVPDHCLSFYFSLWSYLPLNDENFTFSNLNISEAS